MIKIAGIVMSVVIGMGAVGSVSAAVGDVTGDEYGSVFVETVAGTEWVPNTYVLGGTTFTQVSEGSDDYSNGFVTETAATLIANSYVLTTGTASVDATLVKVITDGDVATAQTAAQDYADANDTFVSGVNFNSANGNLTFTMQNGTDFTVNLANLDTNTFVTFNSTGTLFSAGLDASISLATDAELASAISTEVANRDAAISTAVSNAITAEVTARNSAISAAVTTAIATEVLARDAAVLVETNARIAAITAEVTARNSAISTAVSGEATIRSAADTAIRSEFATVDAAIRSEFAAADVSLQSDIDANETARIAADAAIQADVDANEAAQVLVNTAATTDRALIRTELATEKAALQVLITSEATLRASGDSALTTSITAEITARTAAVAALQTQLDNLSTSSSADVDTEEAARIAADTALVAAQALVNAAIRGEFVSADDVLIAAQALVNTAIRSEFATADTAIQADIDANEIASDDADTALVLAQSLINAAIRGEFADADTALVGVQALVNAAIRGEFAAADTALITAQATVNTAIRSEFATAVDAEKVRALAAELVLTTNLTAEAATRLAQDLLLVAADTAAAAFDLAARNAIQSDVDANEASALTARNAIQADVDANEASALTARNAIQADVDANETASDLADTALDGRLDTLEGDVNTTGSVASDIAAAISAAASSGSTTSADVTQNTNIAANAAAIVTETAARIAADSAAAASDLTARGVIQSDVDANETASDLADAALSGRSDALESAVFTPAVERVFGQITLFGSLVYTEQPNGTWTNSGGGVISNDNIVNFYHDPINAPYDIVPVAYVAPQSIVAANAADISQEITARVNAIATLSGQAAHSFTYNSTTGLVTVLAVDGTNLGSFQAGHTFSNLDNGTGAVSEGFATDAQVAAAIAGIESDISTATAAQLTLDTAQRTDIDANTASIGSVATLGVFTSSANAVYTQDATDGRFYTPGNNYGYSLNTIQSWINGGDGSWTVEPAAGSGLSQDLADETSARIAADAVLQADIDANEATATTDRAAIRSEFAAADAAIQADIDANESSSDAADVTLQSNIDSEQAARIAADTAVAAAATDALEAAVLALNKAIKDAKDAQDILEAAQNGSIADNSAAISAEVTRATAAESVIQSDVDANEAASIAADVALNVRVDTNAADLVAETVARIQFETKQAIVDAVQNGRLDTIEGILIDHESRISALEALHVVDKSFSKVIDGPNGTKIVMHFDADGTMRGKARTLTFLENPVIHGEMDILWNNQGKAVNAITGKLVDADTGLPMADKVEAEVKVVPAYVAAELSSDVRFGTVESVSVEAPVAPMVSEEVVMEVSKPSLSASVADLFSGMFSSKTEVKAEVKVTEKSPMNVGNPFGK